MPTTATNTLPSEYQYATPAMMLSPVAQSKSMVLNENVFDPSLTSSPTGTTVTNDVNWYLKTDGSPSDYWQSNVSETYANGTQAYPNYAMGPYYYGNYGSPSLTSSYGNYSMSYSPYPSLY